MTATLPDEVLGRLLEAGGAPVSGEALARGAGVTRAAVWKAIEALRREGYEIEPVPARGYSLATGTGALRSAEIAARLSTAVFGRELRVLAEVDSTNREAARWAAEGAPEGATVVAARQTAGRGRLGRTWFGEERGALMASVVLRPQVELAQTAQLTYVTALALAQTLTEWLPEEIIEIKWPNDLQVRGRKVAGILLESRIEGGLVDFVVAGLGVNVKGSRAAMPEEIRNLAAIVAEEASPGEPPSLVDFLAVFLSRFEGVYQAFEKDGFGELLPEWRRFFRMAGRPVTVAVGSRSVSGVVEGMTGDGSLALATESGREFFHAGDVTLATTRVS